MTTAAAADAAVPSAPLRPAPAAPPAATGVHPRNRLNDLTGKDWVKSTKSWFVCDGRAADFTDDIIAHPASYPPEMAMRFIRFFTKAGGVVLDPFAGCGSTLEAAWRTGRWGWGIELNPRYAEGCRKRIAGLAGDGGDGPVGLPRLLAGDAREADRMPIPSPDLVLTSPPYWNMLKRSRGGVMSVSRRRKAAGLDTDYGDDPADLGVCDDYGAWLEELAEVFRRIGTRMRPGGHVVVVMQNIRTAEGTMRPAAWDLAARLARHFLLRQEVIWCQDQKFLGCWGYPTTYVSNVHHHYCLVLERGR